MFSKPAIRFDSFSYLCCSALFHVGYHRKERERGNLFQLTTDEKHVFIFSLFSTPLNRRARSIHYRSSPRETPKQNRFCNQVSCPCRVDRICVCPVSCVLCVVLCGAVSYLRLLVVVVWLVFRFVHDGLDFSSVCHVSSPSRPRRSSCSRRSSLRLLLSVRWPLWSWRLWKYVLLFSFSLFLSLWRDGVFCVSWDV